MSHPYSWGERILAVAVVVIMIIPIAIPTLWFTGTIQRFQVTRALNAFYGAIGDGDDAGALAMTSSRDPEKVRPWIAIASAAHGPPTGIQAARFQYDGLGDQITVHYRVRFQDGTEEHAIAALYVSPLPPYTVTFLPPRLTLEETLRLCYTASGVVPTFGEAGLVGRQWRVRYFVTRPDGNHITGIIGSEDLYSFYTYSGGAGTMNDPGRAEYARCG